MVITMKKAKHYIIIVIGIILLILGLYLAKTTESPGQFLMALPYVCIGVGCGMLGHGISGVFTDRMRQKNPDIQNQNELNEQAERNIILASRAKAKAYDLMTFVFGALMIAFALMGVDMIPILLLVFAYLLVHGYGIYYRCKYEREM